MAYSLMRQVPIRFLKLGVSSGIRSLTGEEVGMIFWAVPYSPEQMLKFKPVRKVIAAARYCEQRGAEIIGLGAYTSIIGEYGQQVANAIKAGITTGNSLTAATGVEGLLLAARRMDYDPGSCTAAVIGAGGSVGKVASQLLAEAVGRIILVGRDPSQRTLHELVDTIGRDKSRVCDLGEAVREAMLFITVTSATTELEIDPYLFQPGAVICDIARPRDISRQIAEARDDLLVFEGAILKVPGDDVDLGFKFGFPPGMTYACMAETMVLALEGVTTDYSLGKELELWRVRQIAEWARKHGFTLAGFRSFEHALKEEQIDHIRERAIDAKAKSHRGR
jgi:predicted amino acid dehydrogenase